MPIGLTHLGEALAQALIEKHPQKFFELSGLSQSYVFGEKVFREVSLNAYCGRRFDGASRVDLVVPIAESDALAVEVKLGETRLSKRRVETEFLAGCRTSHQDTAWAGNMMSILDQLVPEECIDQRLTVNLEGKTFRLLHEWCVLVRRKTAEAWIGDGRPTFNRARVIVFDELVAASTPSEFNSVVRDLLSFSYYDEWFTLIAK